MTDRTTQERFASKKKTIERTCEYGLAYFCDGTPNFSIEEIDKDTEPKPRCANYNNCPIRKYSVFDESGWSE